MPFWPIADRTMLTNQVASRRSSSTARSVDADDMALIERVMAQDKGALAALYREYHRRLVRFLGRFTRRDDVIEEVINDTFLIVWQKASEFRGQARVSTWLMGIAYRVTLKALRQGGLSHEPLHGEHDERASEPFADHELADWVAKGLMRLSPEHRLVLELAYVMGHSLEEIAEITTAPVSTVKARMFHARVKLRNVMPGLAGFAGDES
ncbi:RNA polymerase sigma-70 factor, ECF subfamily [Paraburkholderia phenazinium]|uniref:RNA polymerase sigma-70 factor, ECF subfamily n=2 Tax=Paraburkholderia phenazinium TaxID=60549 RepID=A0A1G8K7F0_9BURK|nr:RNA polymerase sigma-70 factor, ECF subfamily [Paraburkholderia phenazinium]